MRSGRNLVNRLAVVLLTMGGSTAVLAGPAAASVPQSAIGVGSVPATAATDGPPQIFYTTPQIARPAGGTPIRIVGAGFFGTTSITFGNGAGHNAPALNFRVIDSTLITATVPSQAAVGAVDGNCNNWGYGIPGVCSDIRITDNQGTGTGDPNNANGMFFTDATLTISPQPVAPGPVSYTNCCVGPPFTTTLTNYAPNAGGAIVEMNPLVGFLEGKASCATAVPACPADFRRDYRGPPPYIYLLGFTNTGPGGNFLDCGGALCQATPFFNHSGPRVGVVNPKTYVEGIGYKYDHNVACSPNQQTADYGLPQCMIGFGQYARGTVERHVDFGRLNRDGTITSTQRVPASPTLALSSASAAPGDTVTVSGVYWNDNPYFGSATTPNGPGETKLIIALCNGDGTTNCIPVPGATATVSLTRYRTTSTSYTAPTETCTPDGSSCTVTSPGQPIHAVFSGTTLQGSFVVPRGRHCAPNCTVRVSQEGYNYDAYNGQGTGTYISAMAPLTDDWRGHRS